MRLAIDPGSPLPPFEQVREQLATAIRRGALAPETRLPTVRRLAGDLSLAPNTVARAYRELERDHLIETRGRNGTFVAAATAEGSATIEGEIRRCVDRLRQLDVPPEEVLRLIARELDVPLP